MDDKPTRCIDPVIKFCQECQWGWTHYPDWVETSEDLSLCTIESGCILGFDQGRPEDEPTEEELKAFEEWRKHNDRTTDENAACGCEISGNGQVYAGIQPECQDMRKCADGSAESL